jgi:hypothetical protein
MTTDHEKAELNSIFDHLTQIIEHNPANPVKQELLAACCTLMFRSGDTVTMRTYTMDKGQESKDAK